MNEEESEVDDATLDLVSDIFERWLRDVVAEHALYGNSVILAFDEAYSKTEDGGT